MRILGFTLDFFSWTIVLVIVAILAAPVTGWLLARRVLTWLRHYNSFKFNAPREVAIGTALLLSVLSLTPD